ncbi:hypothetical protein EMPS_04779 [Entomortierella parvispora]|uniref:SRPBCC domain-containing protein n=1 Tax=Entomortierella parvispora TaxID=205924 RepID=A0A9P3H9V8_9FUNG|nr:hypothetical protein EMPS_04779 [Entomortierella parvispora]
MKENKASITIEASPQIVWQVLTDLNSYPEWNPLFVQATGTIAVGESLQVKMRLPLRIFCGAPLTYNWSPRIIKVEPNSCLEWFAPAGLKGFIDGTHYFQLTSSHNGTMTEFTQGERYVGWGTGMYACLGTMEDARRGFIAMNTALQIESVRRKHLSENSTENQENNGSSRPEEEVEQLDISDSAAVAAVHPQLTVVTATTKGLVTSSNATASMTEDEVVVITEKEAAATSMADGANPILLQDAVPTPLQEDKDKEIASQQMDQPSAPSAVAIASTATEKTVEKRTSIIGAMSSMFSSAKTNPPGGVRPSLSKENLVLKPITAETDIKEEAVSPERTVVEEEEDYDEEDDDLEQEEDPEAAARELEAKLEREKKNSERIELDLGTVGELSLGDFGF